MILLVDNYDSFTFNLVQALGGPGDHVRVVRNDAHSAAELLALAPDAIVLGPGPGAPADSGVCPELLRRLPDELPLLGVCLGHQALVERYGGVVERDPEPVHGRPSAVFHDGSPLYVRLANPFEAGRYHSLRARREGLPAELLVDAWTADGLVMGVRHRALPRHGVQFHPESILSPEGPRLLAAFVELARSRRAPR